MPIKLTFPFGIIGLPPVDEVYISKHVIKESMPKCTIIPSEPHFATGSSLFTLEPKVKEYDNLLSHAGYQIEHPIRLAFLADNFPTDSFTNDYGETFLQKFTDVASQGMSQIAQMTGAKSGVQGARNIGEMFKSTGEDIG